MKLKKLFEDLAGNMMSQPQQKVDDHESTMAIADLKQLADQAAKLAEMSKPGDELEGWVQSKITKASDYIEALHKYYHYNPDNTEGCSDCGNTNEAIQPSTAYGDQLFSNIENLQNAAKRITNKPENYTVLSNQKGDKLMLTTNNRAAEFVNTGQWMKIGKIDPMGRYREDSVMTEAVSTCCGRCGHKHVKGTSCPKPFLTGKRHCRNRS
jgi:hypothetical protein